MRPRRTMFAASPTPCGAITLFAMISPACTDLQVPRSAWATYIPYLTEPYRRLDGAQVPAPKRIYGDTTVMAIGAAGAALIPPLAPIFGGAAPPRPCGEVREGQEG